VNADLPNPDSFEGAAQFVTADDVRAQLACGPDVDEHVEKIKPFIEVHRLGITRAAAGTALALTQIDTPRHDGSQLRAVQDRAKRP